MTSSTLLRETLWNVPFWAALGVAALVHGLYCEVGVHEAVPSPCKAAAEVARAGQQRPLLELVENVVVGSRGRTATT